MSGKLNPFTKARMLLVLWYSLLLIVILGFFSANLYLAQSLDLKDIVLEQDFGSRVPNSLTSEEKKLVVEQIQAFKSRVLRNLIILDIGVFVSVVIFNYISAARTLKPLAEVLQRERDFVANASHELRTPVASIQTAAEIALRSKNKNVSDYEEVISQVYDQSIKMSHIISELLLLSRIDSGAEKFVQNRINLNELLLQCHKEMTISANVKNQKFEVQVPEKQIEIIGDKNKIKQLITIITENSIKYTPENGKINLKLVDSNKPFIQIIDNGVGIPSEDLPYIFQRFYRSKKTSQYGEGNGLGLSIANHIAELSGAQIFVKSEFGKGSTFSIAFKQKRLK